jgi:hypothetical protein
MCFQKNVYTGWQSRPVFFLHISTTGLHLAGKSSTLVCYLFFNQIPIIMNTGKFIAGGLIGGVLFFLLGWLIYGMLLMDFMTQHMSSAAAGVMRPEAEWPWWAMISGNFGLGFLLSYVVSKSNASSAAAGAVTGGVVMFLFSFSVNLMMYAQMNLNDLTSAVVDMITSAVIGAVVGAVLGWWNGRK